MFLCYFIILTVFEKVQARQDFSLCRVYKKSKFLRAFDRRPPLTLPPLRLRAVIGESRGQQVEDHRGDEATNSHHHQTSSPICMVERTNSLDSSSSVDHHGQTSQNDKSNSMAVGSDSVQLSWDLDQWDLLCSMP